MRTSRPYGGPRSPETRVVGWLTGAWATCTCGRAGWPRPLRIYGKAIAIDGSNAESHDDLGVAFLHEGRLDDAAAQFQAALAIEPENSEAHNNMGNILYRQRRPDEAESDTEGR